MFFEPGFGFFRKRRFGTHNVPEARCVIGFKEVRQLMHDHIVTHEHWYLDESPVEINMIFQGTRTPTKAVVNNVDLGNGYTQFLGVAIDPKTNRLLGARQIPVLQNFFPFQLVCQGNKKSAEELHATTLCIHQCNGIFPAEIERGFTIGVRPLAAAVPVA